MKNNKKIFKSMSILNKKQENKQLNYPYNNYLHKNQIKSISFIRNKYLGATTQED